MNLLHKLITIFAIAFSTATYGLNSQIDARTFGVKCDGVTHDEINAQKALNAATGNTIVFPPGICMINTPLYIPSNITVTGSGIDITTFRATGTFVSPNAGALFMNSNIPATAIALAAINSFTLNQNITIQNLTLDAVNSLNTYGLNFAGVTYVDIQHIKTVNTFYTGIIVQFADEIRIRNNIVLNSLADGIQTVDSFRFLIDNNIVINSGDYGIEADHGLLVATALYSTGYGTISNNIVYGFSNYGITATGQVTGQGVTTNPNGNPITNIVITGNQVTTGNLGGVQVGIGLQEATINTVISNNSISYNVGGGILAIPGGGKVSTNTTIKDNVITNNTGTAIYLISTEYFTIEGNIISNNNNAGIVANAANGTIKNNILNNNNITAGNSIDMSSANNIILEGNTIAPNANATYSISETVACTNMTYLNNYIGTKPVNINSLQLQTIGFNNSTWTRTTAYAAAVGVAPVSLFNLFVLTNGGGAIYYVHGKDTGGLNMFFDIVVGSYYGGPGFVVLSSTTLFGAPAARTYTFAANTFSVQMAAGTYNITASMQISNALP